MDNGQANIDIVFRNGLKDYEVLPPQEVWNSIHPAIRTKSPALLFLRTAALIAVLLTLSFFAYRWTRELSTGPENSMISLNIEAASPDYSTSVINNARVPAISTIQIQTYPGPAAGNIATQDAIPSDNNKITTSGIALLYEKNNLSTYKTPVLNRLRTVTQNAPQKNTINITEPEFDFIPENIATKNNNRWSIAAMASPTYYSTFSSGNSELSKLLASSEQSLLSYSGGVALTYKISKRLSVQSGLYYSSMGQQVGGINSFGGFQKYVYTKGDRSFEVRTTSGTVYTNNPDVFLIASSPDDRVISNITNDVFDPKKASLLPLSNTLRQNFSYLELPVVLRYRIIDRAIDLNLIGGLSYNMLVNNSVFAIVDGARYSIGKTEGINPVSFSSSIGMGMEYNFSNKLSLNLEPTFRYYLNPFIQEGSIMHPYSFGIFSGFSYKF
jgi:Outer membrane protein beta-barrel domain